MNNNSSFSIKEVKLIDYDVFPIYTIFHEWKNGYK